MRIIQRGLIYRQLKLFKNDSRTFASSAIPTTKLFINGKFVESKATEFIDLHNPATNEVITRVPKSTSVEMDSAVASAKEAFKSWSQTSILSRQQTMFRLQHLIKENMNRLKENITLEQGKTLQDAEGDVHRGLQVVEHACGVTSLQLGETLPSISRDMDTISYRLPLGVCAGITPFNFPAMIPLWMFPLALVCGNTFVLKPSERDPGATMILMELVQQAGIPDGVVNVIHGAHEAVTFICDAPSIAAISFVGSDRAGKYIYERGSKNGKRVQCNMGAKNHGVIMPDANKEHTLNQLVGAAFGAAGQRCMALSTAIFVGDSQKWIPELVDRAKNLKVNAGHIPNTDLGPVISPEAKRRICDLVQSGVKEGAKLILDGRSLVVPGFEKGNFVGPTILSDVQVYKFLEVEESRPAAMQIRYAGCKGMLVVDPTLKAKKILFRKSMKKFDSDNDSLEIIKLSEKRAASLNRPLITILEQLGVSKEIFIKLQKDMIQNHIKSMFHEAEACNFLNRNSHLRFDFIGMHKVGIRFTEDPLFRSMIYALFRKLLDLLKTKATIEIPVDKGRAMFGVLDETCTLEYGQVFVQYSDWITDEAKIVKGTIVVTKNPCMHPGDVRKFQAVDVEALHHIRDCIVFPAKGPRPHPDEMAGSDLDGDEYHVMWIEDFFFLRENVDAMHFAMPKDHSKDLERDIEVRDELDHLCDYIVNDNVGLIASAHLVFADKMKEGIFSDNCIRLAKKYAIALDFAKSGIPATRNKSDRAYTYPDFMEKVGEKTTYVSKKALGVLYRNCKRLEMGLETSNNEVEYKVDTDLIWENWKSYKKSALRMYKKYCEQVEYLINIYSFENEGELLAGAIINPPKYYEQRHDLENLKVLLEYEVQRLFRDLEKKFFDEFGGKPVDKQYTEKMYQKASAWYVVTYDMPEKKGRYFGLPWAAADVLKKMKSERYINKGSKTANRKSLLEEIVDRSLSKYIPIMSEDTETLVIYENRLEILDVSHKVLMKWLKSQREFFMIPDFKAFERILKKEFESISSVLLSCDEEYIEQLKRTNKLKRAISPCYYIIETMLSIANIKMTNLKISFTNVQQELGLLSWITLIKLACTYNPQYLGIADKDGNYASHIFYMPQDNVISIFKVNLFDQKNNSSQKFSLKLLHEPEKVTQYLKLETKLKNIEFRFDIGRDKQYVAIFTVMGSRYAIEVLKDLIVLDDFFRYVVEEKSLFAPQT